jgi:hypothetical protein
MELEPSLIARGTTIKAFAERCLPYTIGPDTIPGLKLRIANTRI